MNDNVKSNRLGYSVFLSMITFAICSILMYFFSDQPGMRGLIFQAVLAIFIGLVAYGLKSPQK